MQASPRADGFTGQHLVVIPKSVQEAARKHSLLRGLLVTDAGYFPRAAGHLIDRKQGVATHLVVSCLRGSGWVRDENGTYPIHAGNVFWLNAHHAHAYGAEELDPWTIGWAHFFGEEAEAWKNHIGFGDESCSILSHATAEGATALKLEQVYLTLEHGYSTAELIDAGLMLRSAFAMLRQAVRSARSNRSPSDRIALVCEHLREHLAQSHRLEELASAAGLSVPHFSALFRRQTGYSPIDFLIRQRIHRACQLLDTTQLPVSAVAQEVGYDDPYYFARCFRRVVGASPTQYRRVPKG